MSTAIQTGQPVVEPQPPLELPVLDKSPGHLIRCAQQVHERVWQQLFGKSMTSVQFGILLVLGAQPEIDQRTVGELMSLDKSNVGDVLLRLELRGLASRDRDPQDGRRNLVRLTPAGQRALAEASAPAIQVQERILHLLSPDGGTALLEVLSPVAFRGGPPSPPRPSRTPQIVGWPSQVPPMRLHAAPGHLIRRAQQVHTVLWVEHVSAGLSSIQYAVLLVLHDEPDIDQRRLGGYASLDKSTGSAVIARMETRGLITRSRDGADGRRNLLRLTASGQRQLFRHAPGVMEVQRELLNPLTLAQRQTFLSLMRRVNAQLP